MCGRFAFYSAAEAAAALFGSETDLELAAQYNLAPTDRIPAIWVSGAGERRLGELRWGLVPSWAKDPTIGNRMINARAETVAEKPAFRAAYQKRRCLIIADGFYEWRKVGSGKTPYFIVQESSEPLAFAGLWEDWTDKETGECLQTATIVTTAANAFMRALHQRMPVIVPPSLAGEWLGGSRDMLEEPAAFAPKLLAWPVSREVSNSRNEGAGLIEPVGDRLGSAVRS